MSLTITRNAETALFRVKALARRLYARDNFSGDELGEVLTAIPILTKSGLVAYGNEHREDFLTHAILFSETSGTTTIPLQTPRGMQDLAWNALNQSFAYKQLVQPGADRVAILHPSVLSPFVEASAMALQALGIGYVRIFPIPGVCEYRRIFDVLERYEITTVMSTPALIYKLLFEFDKLKEGALPSSLKKILATGERFASASAANIERILGAGSSAVPFVYGTSEIATVMTGRPDCTYRPIQEDFVFEIHSDIHSSSAPGHAPGATEVRGNLIVTWLRHGILPILRYDTGDVFTVSLDPHVGEYVFRFEGRNDSGVIDIDTQQKIEDALFSLSSPIYNFECRVDASRSAIHAEVIVASGSRLANDEVIAALTGALDGAWSVSVELNRPNHPFFNFSPSPKIRKFIKC